MKALLAAGLALFAATPAAAQTEALLECATSTVTPAFRERLTDSMLGDGGKGGGAEAMFQELARVSSDCADRNSLADGKRDALFSYNVARLPHDTLIVRLGDRGLSAQVIDQALDFGTGRSNPVIKGDLDQAQLAALLARLKASGVNVDKVTDPTWEMIGAYAAATSLMWQARRELQ
ncbi:MAG: hypothetical protein ABW203_00655 [Novosphingobium sp.]